ncbi:MAG: hypothetical protein PHX72_01830 [Candidatus Shapirobacteria bacterium]|nr:hypothetical protein [Candidatus Shapirobacteria bacterium]
MINLIDLIKNSHWPRLEKIIDSRQKKLKQKTKSLLFWKTGCPVWLKQLPHNYRTIAAKITWPLIITIFWIIFIINLIWPASKPEKTKTAFLNQPEVFSNRMAMVEILIANNDFDQAKKELLKINPGFLSEPERVIWQKNYLSWTQNSPEGQKKLIASWQKFLEQYPDYKIGWLYLGYYQLLSGERKAADISFQKARSIDPGLEKIIEKISTL